MEKIILPEYSNWKNYLEAVGDNNPAHRDLNFITKNNLERLVAPGMWIMGMLIPEKFFANKKEYSLKFEFRKPIFEGSKIFVEIKNNESKLFYNKNEREIGRVYTENRENLEELEINFETQKKINPEDIKKYMDSSNSKNIKDSLPLYIASLSGPALLSYGEENNIPYGYHISQSFNWVDDPDYSKNIKILIGNGKRTKRGILTFDLNWKSEENIFAYGKSIVFALE